MEGRKWKKGNGRTQTWKKGIIFTSLKCASDKWACNLFIQSLKI